MVFELLTPTRSRGLLETARQQQSDNSIQLEVEVRRDDVARDAQGGEQDLHEERFGQSLPPAIVVRPSRPQRVQLTDTLRPLRDATRIANSPGFGRIDSPKGREGAKPCRPHCPARHRCRALMEESAPTGCSIAGAFGLKRTRRDASLVRSKTETTLPPPPVLP